MKLAAVFEAAFHQSPLAIAHINPQMEAGISNARWHTLVAPWPWQIALRNYVKQGINGIPGKQRSLQVAQDNRNRFWDVEVIPMENAERDGCILMIDDVSDDVLIEQRLEKRIADRTLKLAALYDVMSVAGEEQDLRTTLEWSLGRVLKAVGSKAGALHLLSDLDKDAIVTEINATVVIGLSPRVQKNVATLPIASYLLQQILEGNESISIDSIADDTRTAELFAGLGQRAFIGVPMRARGRNIGMLSVFIARKRAIGAVEINLLDSVADQIAIIIENGYLHRQKEQLAVLEERNRLARELHDSVTQSVYSLNLFAEAGIRLIKARNLDLLEECLQQLKATSQQTLREMRLLVYEIKPIELDEEGLVGALQNRLEAVEGRAKIASQFIVDGEFDELPDEIEEHLYRIAQEALNNALKHSSASLLTVKISADKHQVKMTIADDGAGFNMATAVESGGMGLDNIEQRAEEISAELEIQSTVGEGTQLTVTVDLDALNIADDLFT